MAIPSQQIGWSQTAKLLWQISKQLENLIKVAGNVQVTPSPTTSTTTSTTTTIVPTTTTTTTASVYKPFTDNDSSSGSSSTACSQPNVFPKTYYFIGDGTYPAVGDTVYYFTPFTGQYTPFTNGGNYNKMSNNSVYATNAQGVVIDIVP